MDGDGKRVEIGASYDRIRSEFRQLVDAATEATLRAPSDGTKWTNRELLFHMVFGFLIVRTLVPLCRIASKLPDRAKRAFATALNTAVGPFNWFNWIGAVIGARLTPTRRLPGRLDRVTSVLERSLSRASDTDLHLAMHFPTQWDPFFLDVMTLGDIYMYPTKHFDFHRGQLGL